MESFISVEKRVALLYDINDFETNPYWVNFVRYLVVGIALSIENYDELSDQELKNKIKDYIVKDRFTAEKAEQVYFEIEREFKVKRRLYDLFHYNLEEKTKLLKEIREYLTNEDDDDLIEKNIKLLQMQEYKKEYKNIKLKEENGMEKFEIVEKIIALLYDIENFETSPYWIRVVRFLVIGIALSIENFEELSDQELKNAIEDYIVNDRFTEEKAEKVYFEIERDFEILNHNAKKAISGLFLNNAKDRKKLLKSAEEFLLS